MRTLVLMMLIGTAAQAGTVGCYTSNGQTFCTNGYSQQSIGGSTYGSDGSSSFAIGNTRYYTAPANPQLPSNPFAPAVNCATNPFNVKCPNPYGSEQ